MRFRYILPAFILCIGLSVRAAATPADYSSVIAWYDSLAFPDAKNLPYVRIARTVRVQGGKQSRTDRWAEGFLVSAEPGAFTVFVCNVPPGGVSEGYPPLATARIERKTSARGYDEEFGYSILDFNKTLAEALNRTRQAAKSPKDAALLLAYRFRAFALARAALQKGISGTGLVLMELAANIRNEATATGDSQTFKSVLLQDIGDAVWVGIAADTINPSISWKELLKRSETFNDRFPSSSKSAYARETAEVFRRMIAEESARHAIPLETMSPGEQAAESVYRLRSYSAQLLPGTMNSALIDVIDFGGMLGRESTPLRRLLDLGDASIPALIAALDDKSFTRTYNPNPMTVVASPLGVLRVSDFAGALLEYRAGRFFANRAQAEAWWAAAQRRASRRPVR